VAECWDNAETILRRSIKQKHQAADEEFITRLFLDEFRYLLRRASNAKRISQAFLKDLKRIGLSCTLRPVGYHFSELDCRCVLHRRSVEKVTGGDFGLTLAALKYIFGSPGLSLSDSDLEPTTCQIVVTEYQRGLLCQAKLKHKNGKWGTLTKSKKSLFPERVDYYGLLLYHIG